MCVCLCLWVGAERWTDPAVHRQPERPRCGGGGAGEGRGDSGLSHGARSCALALVGRILWRDFWHLMCASLFSNTQGRACC